MRVNTADTVDRHSTSPVQKLHGSGIHNVLQPLSHSFHLGSNALVQLERQHVLVILPPVGGGHTYLPTLWHQICFWPQAVTTAEGQAQVFRPAFAHTHVSCQVSFFGGIEMGRGEGEGGGGSDRGSSRRRTPSLLSRVGDLSDKCLQECSDRIGCMLPWLNMQQVWGSMQVVPAGCASEFTAGCAETYHADAVSPELPSEELLEEIMDRRVSS